MVVTEKAMRPASTERQCFYCHQAIGAEHKDDCVLIHRKVRVRMTVEYDVEVPAFWSAEQIEFHRNESSWCANNALDELREIDCLCPCTRFEFIGETDSKRYLEE